MSKDVDEFLRRQAAEEEESKSLKEATRFVVERSLPLPKHWRAEQLEELEFPDDLTLLSMNQLGYLMGVWTSVIAYTQVEVAKADIEQSARWNKYEFEKKKMYLVLQEDRSLNEEKRKAMLIADKEMVGFQVRYEYARARFTLLKAMLSAYQKYYTVLSRELYRRGLGEGLPRDGDEPEVELERPKSLYAAWRKERGAENRSAEGVDLGKEEEV